MKVFVVRHGETAWNKEKKLCGRFDIDLDETGRSQVREVAGKLQREQGANRIRHIVASPLRRARETAGIIADALGLSFETDGRIAERGFGDCEGSPFDDPNYVSSRREPFMRLPGGGESLCDMAARIYPFLDELPRRFPDGGNVLLVCHGAMSKIVRTYFMSLTTEEYFSYPIPNCCVWEYDMKDARSCMKDLRK